MESQTNASSPNAIDLLKADHRRVEALFEEFKKAPDKRAQASVAREVCAELDVHAKIEEKLFYPTAEREADEAEDEIKEGFVEHEGIKRLVKQISGLKASDDYFETRMTVLEEYVKHHVREEETSMFPKIQESDLDLEALGEKLQTLKQRYQAAPRKTSQGRKR